MAGSVDISSKEYSSGIKIVTCEFTADASTAVFPTANLGAERGKELVNVFTSADDTTPPTANCDLSITDSITSRDLVATNGPDSVDASGVNYVVPETASIVIGNLVVNPDASSENIVNSAITTIYLVFKSKF
jgi:hypothetical protein